MDLFVHSLTKYVSGHGDVMGGAVIGSQELVRRLRSDFVLFGGTLDPHAAFLMQRGLKTYYLRYEAQCRTAMQVADFLATQTPWAACTTRDSRGTRATCWHGSRCVTSARW